MECKNARRGFTQRCFSKGFTLIELLVVVLIIGILVAVAMPQYQKAVEKARMVEAVTMLTNIIKGVKLYRLGSDGVPTLKQLDIEVPGNYVDDSTVWTKYFSISLQEDSLIAGNIIARAVRGKVQTSSNVQGNTQVSSSVFEEASPSLIIDFTLTPTGTVHRSCAGQLCRSIANGPEWDSSLP